MIGFIELAQLLDRAAQLIRNHPQYGACYGPEDRGYGVTVVEQLEAEANRLYRNFGDG